MVAAACFKGALRRGVGVLLAESTCDGRVLPESVSSNDLSQRYGQPYAERGHICVSCVVMCVVVRVAAGQLVAASSVVMAGTMGCSAVKFLAILGSRNIFSLFGLSSAATRRAWVWVRVSPCRMRRTETRGNRTLSLVHSWEF